MSDDSWEMDAIEIKFSGSFQCRLATDPDPTDASPKDGSSGNGWTFQYDDKKPLDRIIRLSNPVELRTALVEPWQDTVVKSLVITKKRQTKGQWIERRDPPVYDDVFVGKPVSLGDNVMFDTKAGGGHPGVEALVKFQLKIGGGMFSATGKWPPFLTGIHTEDKWAEEYRAKKPDALRIAAGYQNPKMNEDRRKLMLGRGGVMAMAEKYCAYCKVEWTPLDHVMMHTSAGVFKDLDEDDYEWHLDMQFSRFDGDTLTGQCEGVVTGIA